MRCQILVLTFVLGLACDKGPQLPWRPGEGGSTTGFKQALTELTLRDRGVFLVEVLEQTTLHRTEGDLDFGTHARVKILEVLTAARDGPVAGWQTGQTVVISTDLHEAESLCGETKTSTGSRFLAIVGTSHQTTSRTPFGDSLQSGIRGANACLNDQGDAVLDFHWNGDGVNEVATLSMQEARDFFALDFLGTWDAPSANELASVIQGRCAGLSCEGGEVCFWGVACAPVTLVLDTAPEFYAWRIRVDGTRPQR